MKNFKLLLVAFFLLNLVACNKDNAVEQSTFLNKDHVELIKQMGFTEEDIIELTETYILEGDVVVFKDALDQINKNGQNEGNARLKQAFGGMSFLVGYGYRHINIFLDQQSFNNLNVEAELEVVVNAYNSMKSYLEFNIVDNANDASIIIEQGVGQGTDDCAEAGFPLNGRPGSTIIIDEGVVGANFTHNQMVFLIAHELGHCIGLRHTNWHSPSNGWGPEPKYVTHPDNDAIIVSALTITGTPWTDNNSVFNRFTCGYSWSGFSYYDDLAIETLYPGVSVAINGPNDFYNQCPATGTYTAHGSNGTGSYSYKWYLSTKAGGFDDWLYIGSGSSVTRTFNYDDFLKIRVDVTSGEEHASSTLGINNKCLGGGGPL